MSLEIISILLSLVGLSVAIIATVGQNKADKREVIRHKDFVHTEAIKFILKYTGIYGYDFKSLLVLCIMAYKYNPIYLYKRDMYNEFCMLTDEVKSEILCIYNINVDIKYCKDFDKVLMHKLNSKLKHFSNDKLFKENNKYLGMALRINKDSLDIYCEDRDDNSIIEAFKMKKVQFKDYISDILCSNCNKDLNVLTNEKLFIVDSWGNDKIVNSACDDVLALIYLHCYVAKYVMMYNSKLNINFDDMFEDISGIKCMEDLFLEALWYIFIND